MAAQDGREPGDIAMGEGLLGPMAQDIPEQDIVMVEEELPPQMDPEPEMGRAAAAFDPPPLLRQNPSPAPGGSTPDNGELTAVGLADVRGMLDALMGAMRVNAQAMNEMNTNALEAKKQMDTNFQQMENKMETSTCEIKTNACRMSNHVNANIQQVKDGVKEEMREMRGEMQNMGRGLQAGIEAMLCDETRTAGEKMAPPRAGTNELGGVQRLSGPRWRRVRTG